MCSKSTENQNQISRSSLALLEAAVARVVCAVPPKSYCGLHRDVPQNTRDQNQITRSSLALLEAAVARVVCAVPPKSYCGLHRVGSTSWKHCLISTGFGALWMHGQTLLLFLDRLSVDARTNPIALL